MYSGGGIKRNLKFYFDITVCDMHDQPVTVNKGRSIEGFFPWKMSERCPVHVYFHGNAGGNRAASQGFLQLWSEENQFF